jgi:TolB-like protein
VEEDDLRLRADVANVVARVDGDRRVAVRRVGREEYLERSLRTSSARVRLSANLIDASVIAGSSIV